MEGGREIVCQRRTTAKSKVAEHDSIQQTFWVSRKQNVWGDDKFRVRRAERHRGTGEASIIIYLKTKTACL